MDAYCPDCGAPRPERIRIGSWGGLLLIASVVFGLVVANEQTGPSQHSEVNATSNFRPSDFDMSPQKQTERAKIIQDGIDCGWWTGTHYSGKSPRLRVAPLFQTLDEKTQNDLLSKVYAYWLGRLDDFGKHGSGQWDPLIIELDNGAPAGRLSGEYEPVSGVRFDRGTELAPTSQRP